MSGLKEATVLIVGGAGSLGVELTKELLKGHVHSIRVLDISERSLYELQQHVDKSKVRMLLGDVRNPDRLSMAMSDVDHVIMCAAVKSVDIAHDNPMETVDVNVNGTFAVVREAFRSRPKKVLLLSSDKALMDSTSGVYHASKFIVEEVGKWANFHSSHTKFSCFRPANFVPSNMNVFETWFQQYKSNHPLTVTSPHMTRYFIPTRQAAQYAIQALLLMRGGETFVPPATKFNMLTLAKHLKTKYCIIGLRPADRLFEELMSPHERKKAKIVGGMWMIRS